MGFVKRAVWDVLKAGLPRFRGPVVEAVEDVYEGNQNVQFIRGAVSTEAVNGLAARRAGDVEDAMFVARVVRTCRKRHPPKKR